MCGAPAHDEAVKMLDAVGLRVGQLPSLEMPAAARNAEALGRRWLLSRAAIAIQAKQDRDGRKPKGEEQDASATD